MTSHAMALIKNMWPDFTATEKDFRDPSQEFLMKFYELFFDECAIMELRMQTPPDVLHPESLNDTLPIISTAKFLSYISSHVKGPQVGLEDIIAPNPKKTWKLMENFANFAVYIDAHVGNLSLIAYDNAKQASTQKEDMAKEIDDVKEKLNEIALRKSELASNLKKLDNQLHQNHEIQETVQEQCLQAEEEYKLLSDDLLEKKMENCTLEKEIEKELEEIMSLKGQIVSSPDTISRTIAELNIKKKDMESDQTNLRNRTKQMMLLDKNLEQIASMIQSKLPQVDDLSANLTFLRDLENGLKDDEAAVKSEKEKFDAAAGRYQEMEKELHNVDQEIKSFKAKSVGEQRTLDESIQQALKKKEEVEHKQIELGAQQVVLAQEICQMREEIKDVEKGEREFIKYVNEMEDKMYDEVRMFKKRLNDEAYRILEGKLFN